MTRIKLKKTIILIALLLLLFLLACKKQPQVMDQKTPAQNYAYDTLARCESMDDYRARDLCYQTPARILLDFSICDKMIQEEIKGSCYGYIIIRTNLEASGCDKSDSQDFIDNCYNVIAISTGDVNYCLNIKNEELRESCITYQTY